MEGGLAEVLADQLKQTRRQQRMACNLVRRTVRPVQQCWLQIIECQRDADRCVMAVHNPWNIVTGTRGKQNRSHCRNHQHQDDDPKGTTHEPILYRENVRYVNREYL